MKQPPVSRRKRESSADASEPRVLSYKELAKEKRHAMYQLAKARRATDPRYLSMLEAVKLQRRAAYQKVTDRRKAEAAEAKAKVKAERSAQYSRLREPGQSELMKLLTWVKANSISAND